MNQERLIRIEQKQDQFCQDRVEVKGEIIGLKGDVAKLKSDVAELKTDVAELKTDIKMVKTTLNHHSARLDSVNETLCILVETLDERDRKYEKNRQEDRRHFEILLEHQQSYLSTVVEGLRTQRTRLDDHEVRIIRLEAS